MFYFEMFSSAVAILAMIASVTYLVAMERIKTTVQFMQTHVS
jgi:hypothetical protein